MITAGEHRSVLLPESIELLHVVPTGIYVDGTLGLGGHSAAIAAQLTTGRLIAFELDPKNQAVAEARLAPWADRITIVPENFSTLTEALEKLNMTAIDGVLLDLGLSSPQVDQIERGFSFRPGSPLDMRFSPTQRSSAADLLNTASERELARLFLEYGEEKNAARLAAAIVHERKTHPFTHSDQLVAIASQINRHDHLNPATRLYQALRIAVNDELQHLTLALQAGWHHLAPGGRLVVISYHSLEDRIVKQFFRQKSQNNTAVLINKKPLTPSASELHHNPRSRSAKLRALQKNSLTN